MKIASFAQNLMIRQQVQQLQTKMAETQSQVSTGLKADSFADLRSDAAQSLGLRNRLATIDDYKTAIGTADIRLETTQTSLGRLHEIADEVATESALATKGNPLRLPQLQGKAQERLTEAVGLLNAQAQGRFLFGGTKTDGAPVADAKTILNGDPATGQIGLVRQIQDRATADQVSGSGGLTATASGTGAAASVTIGDSAVDGFGFTLKSMAGPKVDVTPAAAAGGGIGSFAVGGLDRLASGDTLRLTLGMPDGSDVTVELKAGGEAGTPGAFALGSTPEATAASLASAAAGAIKAQAGTSLKAASATEAANMLFDVPARIVQDPTGTPRAVADDPANPKAVSWYRGDTQGDPRDGVRAKVDDSLVVSYGVRADEAPMRDSLKSLALMAAVGFSNDDGYKAFAAKTSTALTDGTTKVQSLIGEVGGKQETLASVRDRQDSFKTLANNQLVALEGADPYEASARLLQYQTQLQATYSITGRLANLSLINYM